MPRYRVHGDFDFNVRAQDRSDVQKKVATMLRESGFEDKNFEISVNPIRQKEVRNGNSREVK